MRPKVIKKTESKNYDIDDFKNPPKSKIVGYRTKVVIGKDGKKHLVRLALVKDPKTGKIKTKATSLWHSKKGADLGSKAAQQFKRP